MSRNALVATVALGTLAGAPATLAHDIGPHSYTFCDKASPCVSKAGNGSRVEIYGKGTFTAGTKIAIGGGSFKIENKKGKVIAKGKWTAADLKSYHSWGSQGAGEGGKAVLDIKLTKKTSAILTIFCKIGHPPAGTDEGVTVKVGKVKFKKIISGSTLFKPL